MEYMTFQAIGTDSEKQFIKRHVKTRGIPFTKWMKQAIVEKLAAEGVKLSEQRTPETVPSVATTETN